MSRPTLLCVLLSLYQNPIQDYLYFPAFLEGISLLFYHQRRAGNKFQILRFRQKSSVGNCKYCSYTTVWMCEPWMLLFWKNRHTFGPFTCITNNLTGRQNVAREPQVADLPFNRSILKYSLVLGVTTVFILYCIDDQLIICFSQISILCYTWKQLDETNSANKIRILFWRLLCSELVPDRLEYRSKCSGYWASRDTFSSTWDLPMDTSAPATDLKLQQKTDCTTQSEVLSFIFLDLSSKLFLWPLTQFLNNSRKSFNLHYIHLHCVQ